MYGRTSPGETTCIGDPLVPRRQPYYSLFYAMYSRFTTGYYRLLRYPYSNREVTESGQHAHLSTRALTVADLRAKASNVPHGA